MLSKYIKPQYLSILMHSMLLLSAVNFVHQNSESLSEAFDLPNHIDVSLDVLKDAKVKTQKVAKPSAPVLTNGSFKKIDKSKATEVSPVSSNQNLQEVVEEVEEVKKDKEKEIKLNYTQILSKHFAAVIEDSDIFDKIQEIYLMIKVSPEGDIISYDCEPKVHSEAKTFVSNLVISANPVPAPPKELASGRFNHYIVPIFLD